MKTCQVCDLPYMTRKEIEGMSKSAMTAEEVEKWIELRFRLGITREVLQQHQEKCQGNTLMQRLIEGSPLEPSIFVYFDNV